MKILNLYACLGGNRFKWGNEHEITAVEIDPEAAKLYKQRFPNDNVIVGDAHEYLINHYKQFDFIWSSPPCPTHSRFQRTMKTIRKMKYPDMRLYQEILLLQNFFEGKYCVENVISYYDPLIPAQKRGRHLFWTNFILPNILSNRKQPSMNNNLSEVDKLSIYHDFDIRQYKGKTHLMSMARNLVDYEAGATILNTALGIIKKENINQLELF